MRTPDVLSNLVISLIIILPSVVSTDCEALLKKFLALNPTKRYTLEQIMKDKWMNLNEYELNPYHEPLVVLNDFKAIESLLHLKFNLADVEKSLSNRKFDEIYATYLLVQNGGRKLSRSKQESMTSIASASASSALPSTSSPQKSETITNGDGLKETSFMTKPDEIKAAKHNEPPLPEIALNNFKRQHTIGPESLKERNATRLHTGSGPSRPISATHLSDTERALQKSPQKPMRAFKSEASLSTTAATPRRPPNVNVYKKVETTKEAPLLPRLNAAAATNSSSSSSTAFARNGPLRYLFHSGQSRREHSTLESKIEPPAFGKGNFLQRLMTRFSKLFCLSQAKAGTETSTSKN